jgi:hypothetical protein
MISVFVTVPNEHWLHAEVVNRLMRLLQDPRYRLRITLPSQRPLENNLHQIIVDFLASDFDFWLCIDADNPPMHSPLDLVELDLDIIACPTPIWHYTGKPGERPIYWNAYDYVQDADAYREHSTKEGLQRVDAVGGGCFLVARRVLEHPDMRKGAFTRQLYPDGRVHKGNDLSFSERARCCGFELYAHYGYPCSHFCEVDLAEVERAIKGLLVAQKGISIGHSDA